MIGGNAFQRRAEEFDAAVSARASSTERERYADLLELVGAMRAVPAPAARPEYVAALRDRLVTAAAAMPATPRVDRATELRLTPTQRRGGRRDRRVAALIGGFAVVAASGSMAVASQSALPGDVLYPVKRAIENAHANLQSSPVAQASVLLDNADNRLSEVEDLSTRGDHADAAEIASTLQAFRDQTNQASAIVIDAFSTDGDEAGITEVRTFAGSSMDRLAALDEVLPTEARPALIAAAQTVRSIDSAAFEACPTCTDEQPAQLPDFTGVPVGAAIPLDPTALPLPGVATHPRSGDPTSTASGAPQAAATDSTAGPAAGTDTSGPDGSSSMPAFPSQSPPHDGGIVGGTVDKITKGILGGSQPSASTSDSGSGSSSGGLLGDTAGILGLK